jgi:hypothetical protein
MSLFQVGTDPVEVGAVKAKGFRPATHLRAKSPKALLARLRAKLLASANPKGRVTFRQISAWAAMTAKKSGKSPRALRQQMLIRLLRNAAAVYPDQRNPASLKEIRAAVALLNKAAVKKTNVSGQEVVGLSWSKLRRRVRGKRGRGKKARGAIAALVNRKGRKRLDKLPAEEVAARIKKVRARIDHLARVRQQVPARLLFRYSNLLFAGKKATPMQKLKIAKQIGDKLKAEGVKVVYKGFGFRRHRNRAAKIAARLR